MGNKLSCYHPYGFGKMESNSVPPKTFYGDATQFEALEAIGEDLFEGIAGDAHGVPLETVKEYCLSNFQYIPVSHIVNVISIDSTPAKLVSKSHFVSIFISIHTSFPSLMSIGLDKHHYTAAELQRIIRNTTGEVPDIEECTRIIETFSTGRQGRGILTEAGFARYFGDFLVNSHANSRYTERVYQNMNLPLSQYFICSSHNTYLAGNQWNSKSSASAIKRSLLLGVRVVELDCWETDTGEPIVTHGYTLCQPTSFLECIEAVRDYAHDASEYPVVITLENHCSLETQSEQARILKEVLGDKLYVPHEPDVMLDLAELQRGPEEWMSPQDLRFKVIVRDKPIRRIKKKDKDKAKKATMLLQERKNSMRSVSVDDKLDTEAVSYAPASPSQRPNLIQQISRKLGSVDSVDGQNDSPVSSVRLEAIAQAVESRSASKDLLYLVYVKNYKLDVQTSASGKPEYKELPYRSSSSIDEKKFRSLVGSPERINALHKYTRNHLIRVYPAGERIDSSNFNPMPGWQAGCQMVALNYQTTCPNMWLSHGKFRDNGGCGYLLKPQHMLEDGIAPITDLQKLTIRIISGHMLFPELLSNLRRSSVKLGDPFVEVSIFSHDEKAAEVKKTKIVKKNCFNPTWNETLDFSFRDPTALVLIVVKYSGEKDTAVGQTCLPVNCIRRGFRACPLLTRSCVLNLNSFLFCDFQISSDSKKT